MAEADQPYSEAIDVTIGGRRWQLRIEARHLAALERQLVALAAREQRTADDPLALLRRVCVCEFAADGTLTSYRLGSIWAAQYLLWAACVREQPDLTLDEAGELLDEYRITTTDDPTCADLALFLMSAWSIGRLTRQREIAAKNADAPARTVQ